MDEVKNTIQTTWMINYMDEVKNTIHMINYMGDKLHG